MPTQPSKHTEGEATLDSNEHSDWAGAQCKQAATRWANLSSSASAKVEVCSTVRIARDWACASRNPLTSSSCTFLANAGCPVRRVGETQVTVQLRVCRASIARRLCRQLLEEIAETFAGSAFALPSRILEETCKCKFTVCQFGIRQYDGARHEPNRSTGQADDLVRTGCKRLLYRPRSPILQGTRHSWSRWLHTLLLRKDA